VPIDCVSEHRVLVIDRGGQQIVGELTNLARVKWGRVRDDISEAEVDITASNCSSQEDILSSIEPGRHEFRIVRSDGAVWEGPITRMQLNRTGATFYARDVMHYAYRTVMRSGYNNAYPNIAFVTTRAKTILLAELARKEALTPPINVLPYLVEHHLATDAQTSRVTLPMQYTVFEHIDDMAAKAGMDYTVIGRAIHLWDTSVPMGYGPRITENDFTGDMNVTIYGMELATNAIVTDGQGNWGEAVVADTYYGNVEVLATAYDEKEDEGPPPSSAEMASQAQRNLYGRYPTPVIVNIPAGSSLNRAGVVSMDDLVPGVYFDLTVERFGRVFSQTQKLNKMDVEETAAGETVTVDMGPATAPDEAEA
jgi:hypothetical protein